MAYEPVDRRVSPRSFAGSPVASAPGISRAAPAVDNLAGGLQGFSKGLTDVFDRRQKQQDEFDAAQALKEVELGNITDPNDPLEGRSESFQQSARSALGTKHGFDMLRRMQELTAAHGNEPDFDFDAVSQQLIAQNFEGVDDPSFIGKFYDTYNSRTAAMRAKHAESQTSRAIEAVQATHLTNLGEAMDSASMGGEDAVMMAHTTDRIAIGEWKKVPNAHMDTLNEYRISAVVEAAIKSGQMEMFSIFDEADPNGLALANHPKWRDKVEAGRAKAARTLKALTDGASASEKLALKQSLLGMGDRGEPVPRAQRDDLLDKGLITADTHTGYEKKYNTFHVTNNQMALDREKLDGGTPLSEDDVHPDDREALGSSTPNDRVETLIQRETDILRERGVPDDFIQASKYQTFAQFGQTTTAYKSEMNKRFMSGHFDQVMEAHAEYKKFSSDPDYAGVMGDVLDRPARNRMQTMDALYASGRSPEEVQTFLKNNADPELYARAAETVRRAHTTMTKALDDMGVAKDGPNRQYWREKLEQVAIGQALSGQTNGETSITDSVEYLQSQMVELDLGQGVMVHVDDLPPMSMSMVATTKFEDFVAATLEQMNIDIGLDITGSSDGYRMGAFRAVTGRITIFAGVEPEEVTPIPMADGKSIQLYVQGRGVLGTVNWSEFLAEQSKSDRKAMGAEHARAMREAIDRNKQKRKPQPSGQATPGERWRARERFYNKDKETADDVLQPDASKKSEPEVSFTAPELPRKVSNKLVDVIGHRESTNNYSAVNQYGYLGRFQFGAAALVDTGYVKRSAYDKWKATPKDERPSHNAFLEDKDNWSFPGGKDSWLASEEAQDDALAGLMTANLSRLKRKGAITSETPPDRVAGLLMAAHLGGWANAVKFAKNKDHDFKDANNTPIQHYYELGASAAT